MGFALEAFAVFLFYWLFTSSGPPFTVGGRILILFYVKTRSHLLVRVLIMVCSNLYPGKYMCSIWLFLPWAE